MRLKFNFNFSHMAGNVLETFFNLRYNWCPLTLHETMAVRLTLLGSQNSFSPPPPPSPSVTTSTLPNNVPLSLMIFVRALVSIPGRMGSKEDGVKKVIVHGYRHFSGYKSSIIN